MAIKLSENQKNEIDRISSEYDLKIGKESKELKELNDELMKINSKKKKHISKIARLKREKSTKIVNVKDAERVKKLKNLKIKKGDTFIITGLENKFIKIGSYTILEYDTGMTIKVNHVLPKQYDLSIKLDESVQVDQKSRTTYIRSVAYQGKTENIWLQIKQINFKEFLYKYCTKVKRDVNIGKLVK